MNTDAALYVWFAVSASMQLYLSTEEAYKYCPVVLLFWSKFLLGASSAAAGALKAYRSTNYARSKGMIHPSDTGTGFITRQP